MYFAVSVHDGKLILTGHGHVISDTRVDDGQLHALSISRDMTRDDLIYTQLDGHKVQEVEVKPSSSASDLGQVYIGGTLDLFKIGLNGLQGCVHQVLVDDKEIDFAKDTAETANVVPCVEKAVFSSDYMYESLLEENMEDFDEDRYLERQDRIDNPN